MLLLIRSSLAALILAATTSIGQPVPPSSPQALQALQRKLENSQWTHVNVGDKFQSGGVMVIKDGAWLTVRLRGAGRYSAWHNETIVHENRWEVIDANTIRLHDAGPDRRVGLLMRFNGAVTAYTCPNDGSVSGAFMNRLGGANLLVDRWHWNGPGTVNFREDGMAFMEWPNGERGRWRSVGNDRYEVVWAGGKFIDKVRMKSGNKELAIEDKNGRKFGARRVGPK